MLAALALIPAGVLGLLTLQASRSGARGLPGAIAATLVATAVAVYLLAAAVRSRVMVRDTGMERVGVFRRRRVGWPAVSRIAYNPAQRWFFLTLTDGSHLWLREDVAGIGDFAGIALRRVRPDVLAAAGPDVREVLEELAEAARREAARR
jgi:hypothetical protein